ncbi:MAG: hypothetical protein AB1568_12540 [Thermodesulfobacteriota bacterium]
MKRLLLVLALVLLLCHPATAPAGEAGIPLAAAELGAKIDSQGQELKNELRQIKRELAALRQAQEEPGLREIAAGIGYILGLFGVGAYFAGKRRNGHAHI